MLVWDWLLASQLLKFPADQPSNMCNASSDFKVLFWFWPVGLSTWSPHHNNLMMGGELTLTRLLVSQSITPVPRLPGALALFDLHIWGKNNKSVCRLKIYAGVHEAKLKFLQTWVPTRDWTVSFDEVNKSETHSAFHDCVRVFSLLGFIQLTISCL